MSKMVFKIIYKFVKNRWNKKKKKDKISHNKKTALWEKNIGKVYYAKCQTKWCNTIIRARDKWHASHNIPESKGGTTDLSNLRVCCSNCNLKMGVMSCDEWDNLYD